MTTNEYIDGRHLGKNNPITGCGLCKKKTHRKDACRGRKANTHLSKEAAIRLEDGPTEGDREGYIYIYKRVSTEPEDNHWYKIGRSFDFPEGRYKQQAKKNKAEGEFELIDTFETLFAIVTESVIHIQLEDFHRPRENMVDGKEEWFFGNLEHFTATVLYVVNKVRERKWGLHFLADIEAVCEQMKMLAFHNYQCVNFTFDRNAILKINGKFTTKRFSRRITIKNFHERTETRRQSI